MTTRHLPKRSAGHVSSGTPSSRAAETGQEGSRRRQRSSESDVAKAVVSSVARPRRKESSAGSVVSVIICPPCRAHQKAYGACAAHPPLDPARADEPLGDFSIVRDQARERGSTRPRRGSKRTRLCVSESSTSPASARAPLTASSAPTCPCQASALADRGGVDLTTA